VGGDGRRWDQVNTLLGQNRYTETLQVLIAIRRSSHDPAERAKVDELITSLRAVVVAGSRTDGSRVAGPMSSAVVLFAYIAVMAWVGFSFSGLTTFSVGLATAAGAFLPHIITNRHSFIAGPMQASPGAAMVLLLVAMGGVVFDMIVFGFWNIMIVLGFFALTKPVTRRVGTWIAEHLDA